MRNSRVCIALLCTLAGAASFEARAAARPPPRRGRMPPLAEKLKAADARCLTCAEGGAEGGATFNLGLDTLRVPMALHEINRAQVATRMLKRGAGANDFALLQGGEAATRYDTDHELLFRQESYFQYLFGVAEPGCFGALRLGDGAATLFVPRPSEESKVVLG